MEGSLVAYKVFTNGSVLNASEVNENLMNQSVIVFADSTARSSAIPSPIAGMVTYLVDKQALETFNGTSWITAVLGETNTSLGKGSLDVNTGTNNTAVGRSVLSANTTAQDNTGLGSLALSTNTDGSNNTAIGRVALQLNTSGGSNVAVGKSSLGSNTTGANNTSVGTTALSLNTTGIQNVAVGQLALRDNTTGSDNVAVGRGALATAGTASNNVAIGRDALSVATAGNNVAMGRNAGLAQTTAIGNTLLGHVAGASITTGGNNVCLGNSAEPATATTSNSITLGNSAHTSLRCQVTTISSLSDERDKKEIKDLQYGLDLINKVRPVEFTWDTRDGSITDKSDIGFIAQELAEVEDSLNDTDRLRLTLRDNPEKLEATPGRLLPIAIKAIQELSAQNADLLARLEKLENK
jgi:hypothetical protein